MIFNKVNVLGGLTMVSVCLTSCEFMAPSRGRRPDQPKRERIVVHVKEDTDQSVLGKDDDKNGVRDDIQHWIEHELKATPEVKNAAMKLAAVDQKLLADAHDKQRSIENLRNYFFRSSCLDHQFPKGMDGLDQASDIARAIERYTVNNPARRKANLIAESHGAGQAFTLLHDDVLARECPK